MKTSLFCLLAVAVCASASAQGLTVTTSGTVPRVLNPNIAPCSTAPEPYYFQINGTVSRQLQPGEEVRLLVSPILLNGGPIFGCEWIKQCHTVTPGPGGAVSFIGQFGTNGRPRTWWSGAQAQVALAIVPTSAPVCIRNPQSVAIALSNINQINIDPTIPTLYDFQISCNGNPHDVTGTPRPGQTITYTLPNQGAVVFGVLDPNGFLFLGCQLYFSQAVPLTVVTTDGAGVLALPIPNNAALAGVDVSTQGAMIAGGTLDATQPTLVSIR